MGNRAGSRLSKQTLYLLLIVGLGLCLRVYDLGTESLWLNEGYSIRIARLSLSQIVAATAEDVHSPLYFALLHGWIRFLGDSEFSTRLLSAAFGLLAILMTYRVGKLVFDENVGLLSAFLLAVSEFHIRYSQEARGYSLLALLTLVSMYFFIKQLTKRGLWVSLGYVVSSLLLMYTHVFGLFIIIVQNLYILTQTTLLKPTSRINYRKWISCQLILLALFSPWSGILLHQISSVLQGNFWPSRPSIFSIIATLRQYSGSEFLLWSFLPLLLIGIAGSRGSGGNIQPAYNAMYVADRGNVGLSSASKIHLLLTWLLIPVILPFAVSLFCKPIYIIRATISGSLAFYLLVARGFAVAEKRWQIVISAILIVLSVVNLHDYYGKIKKEQWRSVAEHTETNAQPGDLMLFNAGYCLGDVFDYYSKRADIIKKPFPQDTWDVDENTIGELWPTVGQADRVWVVLSHGRDREGLIKKTLASSYQLSDRRKYRGIELCLFERRGDPARAPSGSSPPGE